MLERRTMIGGGVIGPNDTEFMGYPIVNSVEGPLSEITPSNCTEGCITRCILCGGYSSVKPCIIVYVLKLNDTLYLIDSYYQIVVPDNSLGTSNLLMAELSGQLISMSYSSSFPNKT